MLASRATFLVRFQCIAYPIQQVLVAKGLLDEVDGAFLHRFDRHRYVAVTGDKYDRQRAAQLIEFFLQLESAEARHPDVEHEATGTVAVVARKKVIPGMKNLIAEPDRAHQELHRMADRLIVVDNIDCRMSIVSCHCTPGAMNCMTAI